MNSNKELLKKLISEKKYSDVCKVVSLMNKPTIVFNEYACKDVRVIKECGNVSVTVPKDMSIDMNDTLAGAIASGTIFDDADKVENATKYISMTTLPVNGMINRSKDEPTGLKKLTSTVIGRMDDCGCCCNDRDIENGNNFMKDVITSEESPLKTFNDYIDNHDNDPLNTELGKALCKVEDELDDINDIINEDSLDVDDFEEMDESTVDDGTWDEPEYKQEGFLSKKPKKLKPIDGRGIITYITCEMNDIQSANDQAMLSGYTCSKLELVDFYINILDTEDPRYMVPHTKQYLADIQRGLNNLLTQILRLRPINRNDRIWQINYPSN